LHLPIFTSFITTSHHSFLLGVVFGLYRHPIGINIDHTEKIFKIVAQFRIIQKHTSAAHFFGSLHLLSYTNSKTYIMAMATLTSMMSEEEETLTWPGFVGKTWQVHKFGGTSVANADCYRLCAAIVETQLGIKQGDESTWNSNMNTLNHGREQQPLNLSVVVSAMGGKPKVTDLLLNSVKAAAERDQEQVEHYLDLVKEKHAACLLDLFPEDKDKERLSKTIAQDLADIRDILKTVSLMKWQASRISELVSGYGELWSAQILAQLLQNRARYRHEIVATRSTSSLHEEHFMRHEFVFLDARRVITIDEDVIQGGAVCWDMSQSKLAEVYQTELDARELEDPSVRMHFVVTGYVASNIHGVATTLQRDGSDYSAAIMGRLLQSTNITIWTDVDGVLSADPRRVPMAHALPEVSYNEAMELAYFGAKVIHPKTMQPAISANPQIPIFIRNTFNSSFRGTRIYTMSTTHADRDRCVCGFSSNENMALINVEGSGLIGVPGVAKRMFSTLESTGVNVVLISQASSEHSITFATAHEQAILAKTCLEEEFERELRQSRISQIEVTGPCSIIAAVGDGMSDVAGVSGRFFSSLGDAQINVLAIAQGCSERNISAVVAQSQSSRALRALHAAFRLSHTVVRVAIVGMNELGDSLLKLLETERRKLRATYEIDLQVCAVVVDSDKPDIVCLKDDSGEDSITLDAFNKATKRSSDTPHAVQFDTKSPEDVAELATGGIDSLLANVFREECAHHVVFDCTNDKEASVFHAPWLKAGIHVVTANNMGISGTEEQRDTISAAENAHGKLSAQYLREVTVGGGLPIINTLRTLLNSGDKIRRIDGILSVSMSYIMFRVSPPPDIARCVRFDEETTKGAFQGDSTISRDASIGTPCSLSQAVKEAVALDLMEIDPSHDLSNDYSARVLMVLAKELGLDRNISTEDIQNRSDKLVEISANESLNYTSFEGNTDKLVEERVKAAAERGCVLRLISSVDVGSKSIDIKLLEVPNNHVFAVTPPSSACVRFFTHRYQPDPLVVQGPAAGADCTSSALLAELLHLMRSKIGPKSGALSRTGSSAFLS
jgi:aspartokinase/homoserine dehydrogenase 1